MVRLEAGLGRGHEWLALKVVLDHVSVHAVTAASRWRRVHRVDVCVDRSQVTTHFFLRLLFSKNHLPGRQSKDATLGY